MKDPDNIIRSVDKALTNADTEELNATLQSLQPDDLSIALTRELIARLEDNEDFLHEMYGIVHTIERADSGTLYTSFALEFKTLASRAPYWANMLTGRLLNASSESGDKFDGKTFIYVFRKEIEEGGWVIFEEIVRRLHSVGKIPTVIAKQVLK